MGRGGSSLDALVVLLLPSKPLRDEACEGLCVVVHRESLAPFSVLEYVNMMSRFLYGVEQPAASTLPKPAAPQSGNEPLRFADSLQKSESEILMESDSKSSSNDSPLILESSARGRADSASHRSDPSRLAVGESGSHRVTRWSLGHSSSFMQ